MIIKKLSMIALGVAASAASLAAAKKAPLVSAIEPPYWWVGMASDTLQLMIEGPGIAEADVTADYPGVKIVEEVKPGSPDYKLLYLTVAPDARPGEVPLRFTLGKRSQKVDYRLCARDRRPEDYKGFDASDVLYLIMPDRFARTEPQGKAKELEFDGLEYAVAPDRTDHNGRHGGNIQGIIDHLDYIDSLGVTAIWVCPVLENDMPGGSYHGYATTDYYRIDPRFGTNEQWQTLVAEAQKRGIKVVMDMIFNHSGSNHRWMKNAPSPDWYNHPAGDEMTNFRLTTIHDPYVSDYDLDHTVNAWFVPSMPDLNQRNPHLMRYLTQNSIWWVESSKINGIRMDTYPYADINGMAS